MNKFLQKIFKTISYNLFFLIYGKIDKSIESHADDRIKIENVNIEKELTYKIYKIIDGKMYTNRIHDTAVILDNKIINGPSFQYRFTSGSNPKTYNSSINNNIVLKIGTPRIIKNLNGVVLSLLSGGAGNTNYWHWIFDVLPRLGLCSKIINLNQIDYFLLPDNIKKFQNETLDTLNIPKEKRLSSVKFRHIKAKELIITDHPFTISGIATDDIMKIPKWISQWLKDNFLKKNLETSNKNVKKIYIDRNDMLNKKPLERSIINEEEVKKYLLKHDFISVKLHEMKFTDQVELFYNAECVVGLHGGGFANLAFCKPKTKVIELRSKHAGTPIENLSKKNDLNYSSIIVDAKPVKNLKYPNQQGHIKIPINSLSSILEN